MTKTERTCTRCGLLFVTAKPSDPCPGCVLASIVDDPDTEHGSAFWEDAPPVSEFGNSFSHFEVLEEIGRGGMGTVFKARDRVSGRLVALKVLQAHHLSAPDLVERFRSEVRAISSLDHRHILPIHEVGDCDGIPFFSMKLAAKGSLAQHLGDYLGSPRLTAQLTAKIARGVQHAHEHGILHRDLKPGNILLDQAGEPYVCDFGLAKWIDDDRRLTVTAAVLGTPHYIAPEQANGKAGLTVAADIYSLGAILYELLTGRPPFVGETVIDTLRQASENTPARPSSIVRHTPRDLETICLKALEHDPNARYRNAAALAEDLENWLAGRPIRARPVSAAEQLWRWARRNPLPAALGAFLLVALTALAIGSTVAALKINAARGRAVEAEHAAQEQLYVSLIAQARASRMTGQAGHRVDALRAIRKAASIRPSLELRNEAIAALTLVDLEVSRKLKIRDGIDQRLAFDGDLQTAVVTTPTGELAIIDLLDGTVRKTLAASPSPVVSLLHNGTSHVVGRCADQTMCTWDLASGAIVARLQGCEGSVSPKWDPVEYALSPASPLLATGAPGEAIAVVDYVSGEKKWSTRLPAAPACIAFSRDGRHLAVRLVRTATILILNAETGAREAEHNLETLAGTLAWSPDGTLIAVGCADYAIRILDATTGALRATLLGHRQRSTQLLFNHRGDLLVSTGTDRTVRVWNLRTFTEEVTLANWGTEPVLRFDTSDNRIALTDLSTTAAIVRVEGTRRVCTVLAPPVRNDTATLVSSIDYSPDGRLLGAASFASLTFWDAASLRNVYTKFIDPKGETNLRFLDGEHLLIATQNAPPTVYTYRLQNSELVLTSAQAWNDLDGFILGSQAFNKSPALSLVSSSTATGALVNWKTGIVTRRLTGQEEIWDMVASSQDTLIATHHRNTHGTRLWSASKEAFERELPTGASGTVAFSPSGRWLAATGRKGCFVWNTTTWEPLALPDEVASEAARVAFSHDEHILAASTAEQMHLLGFPGMQPIGTLQYHANPSRICRMRFSPDGSQLAVQGIDNTLYIWSLQTLWQELAALDLCPPSLALPSGSRSSGDPMHRSTP